MTVATSAREGPGPRRQSMAAVGRTCREMGGDVDVPDEFAPVIELVFALEGASLPADHAEALARAVEQALPWFEHESTAGILPLRTAPGTHGLVLLARRAKLVLRIPESRLADASMLAGRTLEVAEDRLVVGAGAARPLVASATLYAHRVVTGAGDERAFHEDVIEWQAATGVGGEFISGRARRFVAGGREMLGFGLALHGLAAGDSLRVQGVGFGSSRRLGCGIFVPHKAIATSA